MDYDPNFDIEILDPEGGRLIITGFILMAYSTVFSGLFSFRIASLLDKNEKNNISLDIAAIKLQAQNSALEETFKKLEDAAVINSHRLRAPIARIKGLIIVYNEIRDLDLSEDDPIAAISLKKEILNSIEEFNLEYQHLKELINK
jgi:signal transduction histidine kinase